MNEKNLKVPVLLTIFNRPDAALAAFKSIKIYRPERLYIAADGPRRQKEGEDQLCQLTREAVLDEIDWPCEVRTLLRDENLGCAKAMYGAISWFFEQEQWGIIIEDDIVVGQDFYILCEDLLPRYAQEEKVMEISARNHSRRTDKNNTYVYAQCYHCWGWATWRRAWNKMDMTMSATKRLSAGYLIKRLGWFRGCMMKYYFYDGFRHIDTFNSWATRWYLSILDHDGLVLCPGVNLALNIGMNGGAHYEEGDVDPYKDLAIGHLEWPLVYKDHFVPDKTQTRLDNRDFRNVRWIGLKKKLRKIMFL